MTHSFFFLFLKPKVRTGISKPYNVKQIKTTTAEEAEEAIRCLMEAKGGEHSFKTDFQNSLNKEVCRCVYLSPVIAQMLISVQQLSWALTRVLARLCSVLSVRFDNASLFFFPRWVVYFLVGPVTRSSWVIYVQIQSEELKDKDGIFLGCLCYLRVA